VAGYNSNSYYLLDDPSFLQAEVLNRGKVLAATGNADAPFEAHILSERLQKVQRYSFQRPASEVYDIAPGYDAWRSDPAAKAEPVACAVQPVKSLLPRRVSMPRFDLRQPLMQLGTGSIETGVTVEKPWKDRSLTGVGPKLAGYPEAELARIPSLELQTLRSVPGKAEAVAYDSASSVGLAGNSYAILDFGTNLTGFPGAKIMVRKPTRLYFTFDEILSDNDVDFKRMGCVNIVDLKLPEGVYNFEAIEPYTMRYMKLINLEGDCTVEAISLREYVNPDAQEAQFVCSDPRMNKIFEAARETFRQNAVDVFTDCPSRERAGWLCDSFFTARTAYDLCGNTKMEHNFVENFLLPDRFAHLPEGMLPMCYPADHPDGIYIPNWAMWFVVQLQEYAQRSGDRATVDALKPRVLALLDFFSKYKNEDGLLEKLDSWVFVEWSKANGYVQDVNYPSNMLYAGALEAAGRLYNMPDLLQQAQTVRDTIRKQSFDGHFFVDNALRKDGKLQVTTNRSEVCQYFAFFFDVATPESQPELWKALCEQFGPKRGETKAFPEVDPANAFVGNMLRFEILSRYGKSNQILDETIGYLLYMADRTGTLWENVDTSASCNHGFASHAAHTLYRDVLGVRQVDAVNKVVHVRFTDANLPWCDGRIPAPGGYVDLRWTREGKTLRYHLSVPAGYRVELENPSNYTLQREP
jgi:alpha-L-rhamnosidase